MIQTYIPYGDLPKHPVRHSERLFWMGMDNLESYRSSGGHPAYGELDIIYEFNSYGYRCPEFDSNAQIRMVSIGCSYVLGVGLPQHEIFHALFCRRLEQQVGVEVVNWNLGAASASNDFISRLLFLAIPFLKPHLVIVNFTHPARRDYISADNEAFGFNPSSKPTDRRKAEIHQHFCALSSQYDDHLNLFRNYMAVAALLRNTSWLCSFIKQEHADALSSHLQEDKFVGVLESLDLARDNRHPGRASHLQLAELYWERFVGNGLLSQLATSMTAQPAQST